MKQIICMKWGTKYSADYVNKLYGMVNRNITPPFSFHCFTDNTANLNPEIVTHDIPDLGCKHPENISGIWTKTTLWGKELDGIKGVVLFIDLDSVIVNNIDSFFEFGEPDDIILARNWLKPFQRLGQTTLFRFKIGSHPYLLENFRKTPQEIAEKYRFEQHYVTKNVNRKIKFWPKTWVIHYRIHCLGNNVLLRYFREAKLPQKAKIVAFPGHPQPQDALKGQWTHSHPVTLAEHIKNTFYPQKRVHKSIFKHLRFFQKPCSWIKEHWRE